MLTYTRSAFILMLMLSFTAAAVAVDDVWLYGKWELSHDPDNREKDWLEFLANGDARSHGRLGTVEGIYVADESSVKAVFTYQDKDFIMTFHVNPQKTELRIVTSRSRRESIYRKIK